MANDLTVAGSTKVSWALSSPGTLGSQSSGAELRTSRSISYGTGPNQATVAHSQRITCTGSGVSLSIGNIDISPFGIAGYAVFSSVRELLVSVASGPTGGYLSLAAPGGITGVRVGVGGQLHWADYATGAVGSTVALSGGPTGTYTVDLTLVGIGGYAGL